MRSRASKSSPTTLDPVLKRFILRKAMYWCASDDASTVPLHGPTALREALEDPKNAKTGVSRCHSLHNRHLIRWSLLAFCVDPPVANVIER